MQVLKEDIRSRVLAAARRQFGRKGYSGTSMREIAASAGVGLHHPPAYGMDVHYVRGTADAFGAAAGNGVHTARLHIV